MTSMNQHPAPPSSPHHGPLVEWTPLDELIQMWARFAYAVRSAHGLCAVSAAFAALGAKSSARQIAVEAGLLDAVLSDLTEARLRWVEVLDRLNRLWPEQDEEAASLIPTASVHALHHEQHLAQLLLRLLHEKDERVAAHEEGRVQA